MSAPFRHEQPLCCREGFRRRSACLAVILLALLLFGTACPAWAISYYVSPAGSDANPGTRDLPWQTITKAANTLKAGDTVFIGSGTYRESVTPVNSGASGQYISYTAREGATVIVDGASVSLEEYTGLFFIANKSYIKVSGLQIRNAGPNPNNAGILVDASHHIILQGNRTSNTVSSGIGVWNSSEIAVEANEVELACNDGQQECITVAGTCGFTVAGNHVHHNGPGSNGGEGIDIKDGSCNGRVSGNNVHDLSRLGIYVDAWDKHTYGVTIDKNRVANCRNDGITLASEMGGLLEEVLVSNNVVSDNLLHGIAVTPNGPVTAPPMRNITIINNTFHNNGDGNVPSPWGGGIAVDNPNLENLVIRNNIFSDNLFFQILVDVPVTGLQVDHNLIDGFRDYAGETLGTFPVTGDPLFVDAAAGNYRLQVGSPARDKGTASGAPADDFDSIKRPQGQGVDLGAHEYVTGTRVALPAALLLLQDQ